MFLFPKKIPNPNQHKFIVSSRKLKGKSVYRSLKKAVANLEMCNIEDVVAVFGFVKSFSPLYGGRLHLDSNSLSYSDVDHLHSKGIAMSLTLSNHYYSEEKYQESLPILERLYRKGNSIVITNDDLAKRLRKDFPDYTLKASVIKMIKTQEEIEKNLQLYDYVTLDPKLNDQEEFLQSLTHKEKIILFGSIYCLYHCPNSICYQWFSDYMGSGKNPKDQPCTNKHRIKEVRTLTRFNLNDPKFQGFTLFKLVV